MVPETGRSHRRFSAGPELEEAGLSESGNPTRRRSASIGCGLSRALSSIAMPPPERFRRLENLEADLSAGSLRARSPSKAGWMMGVSLTIGRFVEFAESAAPFDIAFGTPQTLTRINLRGNVTDIESEPVQRDAGRR